MFAFVRALLYATIFVGLLLIYAPARILEQSGLIRPPALGAVQVLGMLVVAGGALLALWCVLTFAFVGRGTPAPFDAPRELVTQGPYRFVRNPMYIGASLALLGAALYYQSPPLAAYLAAFVLVGHLFVRFYEEPTLRKAFGEAYETYCQQANRWIPKFK